MQQLPTNVEGALRFLRILYAVLIFSMVLDVIVAEKFGHHEATLNSLFPWCLVAVGVALLGTVFWARTTFIRPALERLRLKSDDLASLLKWRTGAILTAVLFESLVLLGFALRFIGGTRLQSAPFYVAGIGLMLLFWPRRP
jgi:hypothetical protein